MSYSDYSDSGFFVMSSFSSKESGVSFSGIAYVGDCIVINQPGMDEYLKDHDIDISSLSEGRFSVAVNDGNTIVAKSDNMGQDAMFYYYKNGIWGLSNSLYLLAKHLCENRVSLSVNYETLASMMVSHSSAQQLISNQTPFNEIRVLPAEKFIRVSHGINPNRVDIVEWTDLSNDGDVSEDEYRAILSNFVVESSSRAIALLDSFSGHEKVDISGGVDSRVVLSLIAASGRDLSGINFCSNPNAGDDFRVASNLMDKVGGTIKNRPFNYEKSSISDIYNLWKVGNLGVYQSLEMPLSTMPQHAVHFHGACGECFRDFYINRGSMMSKVIASKYDEKWSFPAVGKIADAFSEMNVDIESKDSSMIHYRNFRSRFHFGRSSFRSLSSVLATPLASHDLLRATRHLSTSQREDNQLAMDIMLASGMGLERMEYDKPEKTFPDRCFESSMFKGSSLDASRYVREIKVYKGVSGVKGNGDEDNRSIKDLISSDLKKFSGSVISSGLYAEEEISSIMENVDQSSSLRQISRDAVRIIYAGEVLEMCV
ncbi:tRNA-specific 2-thiouridylase [Halomonas cupida]|uniref:hypothetical protein n=1 Tax=Halomonas cupida TaxID=44933 RepID=UPI0039B4A108